MVKPKGKPGRPRKKPPAGLEIIIKMSRAERAKLLRYKQQADETIAGLPLVQGMVRQSDGKVFMGYVEHWVTPAAFQRYKEAVARLDAAHSSQ